MENKAGDQIWSLFQILKQITEFVLVLELIKHVYFCEEFSGEW